jgi:hypothetical protein
VEGTLNIADKKRYEATRGDKQGIECATKMIFLSNIF